MTDAYCDFTPPIETTLHVSELANTLHQTILGLKEAMERRDEFPDPEFELMCQDLSLLQFVLSAVELQGRSVVVVFPPPRSPRRLVPDEVA